MAKTIKQIAAELKIDKQKVYRYVRKNHISDVHQKSGVMWCDDAVEASIKQHFAGGSASVDVHHKHIKSTSSDTVTDAVISMLQHELKVKNEQIERLTIALENTTASLQAAQALHAGTMKKQIDAPESGDKKNFLQRIFIWRK